MTLIQSIIIPSTPYCYTVILIYCKSLTPTLFYNISMSFFKVQNNQKQFLKKIKEKEQEAEKKRRKEEAGDRLTAVIKKYLSNKRNVLPIVREAQEKIQSILAKKKEVDLEKFGRMMSNAVFKMPIIMSPVCFVSFETLPSYSDYVLTLVESLTLGTSDSNVVMKKLLQSKGTQAMQFHKVIEFSILLANRNPICQEFLRELIITSIQNQFPRNPISSLITPRTIEPIKNLILEGNLSPQNQELFLNRILLDNLNQFSRILTSVQILSILLNVETFSGPALSVLTSMIYKSDSLSELIDSFIKSRSVPELKAIYLKSVGYLKRLSSSDPQTFAKGLQIHHLILLTYFSRSFDHIKNKLYGKKMAVQDQQELTERYSRVRRTQEYNEFLNTIDMPFYFSSPLQELKRIIKRKQNQDVLYSFCELYLLLENIFRKTHIKLFKLLTDIEVVVSLYQLIRSIDYYKIDFTKRSKQYILFEFFIIITYHKFVEMDDTEFSNPLQSFEKQTLEELIRTLLKLSIMMVRRSITGTIFEYTSLLINDIYKKVFRTKLINLKLFQSENLDKLLENFNATKKQNNQIQLLLKTIPFGFSFEARLLKLRQFIKKDKTKFNRNLGLDQGYDEDHTVEIRRGQEFNDAFHQLAKRQMRQKYRIVYINQQGIEEEGVDGGGIIKELINQIIKVAFNPIYGLFLETSNKEIIPNPHMNAESMKLELQFIGKLVGKAMYENILIEPKFSGPFLNIMMGKENSFQDLQYIDKSLYNSLLSIKHTQENISDSFIPFSIEETDSMGKIKTIELKENGKNILVTQENKLEFVLAYADYKVNTEFSRQGRLFRKGFTEIIQEEWLEMFNYEEINLMISGNSSNINIYDLMENTVYTGYEPKDLTVKYFWEVLNEMSLEDKGLFLHYATSCSRPPTLGFKQLKPKFCIGKSSQGVNYLPTVHTCMNLIKLPDYKNKQRLKQKLLYAIHAKAGFDVI